jgi:RNA polymerase sigma-70 factor (ECF subfamily)
MNPSSHDSAYSLRHTNSDTIDDAAIVLRIANGDETALAALYDRWVQTVYSLAMQLLHNADEAEDIVEETFWHAWQRASTYNATRGTVRAWLLTIGRSHALDRLRSRRRHRNDTPLEPENVLALAADLDPLLDAEGAERRTFVLNALQELPPEQSRVVELAYFHGLSQTEVAEHLGEQIGAIKTRMQLGMHELRDKLLVLRKETV